MYPTKRKENDHAFYSEEYNLYYSDNINDEQYMAKKSLRNILFECKHILPM